MKKLVSGLLFGLLVACDSGPILPRPEPPASARPAASAKPADVRHVPAPPGSAPGAAADGCCAAEGCKLVPGGCGCRRANPNANCGG
jgi:hypothetical protein